MFPSRNLKQFTVIAYLAFGLNDPEFKHKQWCVQIFLGECATVLVLFVCLSFVKNYISKLYVIFISNDHLRTVNTGLRN